jgi:hypothetical protein
VSTKTSEYGLRAESPLVADQLLERAVFADWIEVRIALPEGSNAVRGLDRASEMLERVGAPAGDCGAVLHLAAEGVENRQEHKLLAPTLLRSQTLSALHEAVHAARSRRLSRSTG